VKNTVCVVGGDLRQITVAKLLKEEGYGVDITALDEGDFDIQKVKGAKIIILPVPVTCDGETLNTPIYKEKVLISDIFNCISRSSFVLGGKIPENLKKELEEKNIKYKDYLEREELAIKNAIPTAEGAIEIAISEMPITLFESNVLVVGFGRIGKVLSEKLKLLGANVTVSARKCADFAWIEEKGLKSIHTDKLYDKVETFDLIVNTVPSRVFDEMTLNKVNKNALLLDLSSKPGGVDFESAKKLGKNVIWALSLPGKTAPITSGKIIKETIVNILSETGV